MLTIRPAIPEDNLGIARVHVESWRSTYSNFLPTEYLAELSVSKRQELWDKILRNPHSRSHVFVALNGNNEIIGFTNGGPNRSKSYTFDGEVIAIYLLESYQRQGVGKRLLQASIDRLAQDGFQSMMVWVIEGNPACRFYDSLGGRLVGDKMDSIGGRAIKELAYAWDDLEQRATAHRIYHITGQAQWLHMQSTGVYEHPTLQSEGFIHCSDRQQVLGVANRYFKGQNDLIVLELDASKLKSKLVYENTSGGTENFPHVYGPINLDALLIIHFFPCDADGIFRKGLI